MYSQNDDRKHKIIFINNKEINEIVFVTCYNYSEAYSKYRPSVQIA